MKEFVKSTFNFEKLNFIISGLAVGVATGIVTDAFRFLIEKSLMISQFFFNLVRTGHVLWLIPITLYLLTIGLIAKQLLSQEPFISGSGIPQVEAQLHNELDYRWWPVLWRKFLGGVLVIGPGLALGREGPSIQLGAALGQGIAQSTNQHGFNRRIMIAAGAAGGLSAAFNAPLAGTMFVLEEVYHNFSYPVWITSFASAIGANFVSLNVFGMEPVLNITYQKSFPISDYWHLLILGILLGLLGRFYQYCLLNQNKLYAKLKFVSKGYWGLVPLLAMIPLGIWHADWLGGGNAIITSFNNVTYSLLTLVLLLIVRFGFSMLSYGSGLPGGIFLPILSLGAFIGAVYGTIMIYLGFLSPIYLYNLVIFSMAGYFAAIGKAPFTAILLVTEMVGSLKHLMPLAVLSLTAYIVVDILNGQAIYESLRERLTATSKLPSQRHLDRIEIPIFEQEAATPFRVRDISWPADSLLISIRRGEKQIIPHGNQMIYPGDTLVVLAPRATLIEDQQLIQKGILDHYSH